jgi:hypothetical protein
VLVLVDDGLSSGGWVIESLAILLLPTRVNREERAGYLCI